MGTLSVHFYVKYRKAEFQFFFRWDNTSKRPEICIFNNTVSV